MAGIVTARRPETLAAVIVLFHPDPSILAFIDRMLAAQNRVVLVVNAAPPDLLAEARRRRLFGLIINDGNLGLASALNLGMAHAFGHGADYVLLLDQDSRPEPDLGHILVDILSEEQSSGAPIACIGPRVVDRKQPHARTQILNGDDDQIRDVPVIITSGSVVTREAFEAVGPMRTNLFIDGIDHEWCFRASSRGFRVCVAPSVAMEHDMGDSGVSFLGRYRPVQRRPFRHYYLVRNILWLARLNYIPLAWRLREVGKLIYRIPLYLASSKDRRASVLSVWRGLRDGIFGSSSAKEA